MRAPGQGVHAEAALVQQRGQARTLLLRPRLAGPRLAAVHADYWSDGDGMMRTCLHCLSHY